MATEIYMPQLGLTMTEGTVTRWLKRTGDAVKQGEPVVEIETDKVTTEIEAPADGVLGPILVEEGKTAPIGGVLSYVLAVGESMPEAPQAGLVAAIPTTPAPAAEQPPAPSETRERVVATPRARRKAYELGIDLSQVPPSGPGGRIVEADVRWFADQKAAQVQEPPRVSPVARRLAAELGVDLSTVQGTGEGGRIRREDVERAAAARQAAAAAVPPTPPSPPPPVTPTGAVEALTGVRRIVAERMTRNFTTTPHFYLTAEVDASALTRMRDGLLPRIEAATGIRLTITDILVKVCAHALREHPEINVAYAEASGGPGLVRQAEVNVGVAVALEDGLVVPIVRQADRLSLAEIAAKRAELVARARAGKLSLADLEGGTFTLTNLGMFGVDQFQAIINAPQAAILAVGRVRERPVAVGGAVVIRPTLYLTLSLDHRLVDGAQGARFLERLAQLIEEPYLLLD
ncbi:MAG: 2-oxo acid dehydrogenase subunit E2 [Ardenticatenia bacterium]|nr:MAG: 2-oxo acid dehydrogenase subunit E2 [Ardenticatenia bacterium]